MAGKAHANLIAGLTELYAILVKLCYFDASAVIYSPYPSFPQEAWQAVGFESSVVDILQQLPYLLNQDSYITPETVSYCYACQSPSIDVRDPTTLSDPMIDPYCFTITWGQVHGDWMIYDTPDETIVEWNTMNDRDYRGLPKRPAQEVLGEIIEKFRNLEWVPYHGPVRTIATEGIVIQWERDLERASKAVSPQQDLSYDRAPVSRYMKNAVNTYHAHQKMYRDHGWPDSFDSAGWRRSYDRFEFTVKDLGDKARNNVDATSSRDGIRAWRAYHNNFRVEMEKAVEGYLERMAGEQAVRQALEETSDLISMRQNFMFEGNVSHS